MNKYWPPAYYIIDIVVDAILCYGCYLCVADASVIKNSLENKNINPVLMIGNDQVPALWIQGFNPLDLPPGGHGQLLDGHVDADPPGGESV